MSTDTTAFEAFDSSVFREWAMGLSDVLANCKSEHCAPESINAAGGLIYQLIKAADELEEQERTAQRQ
ncbi:hypothetical protein K3217_14280 [bacterium BD-1]|nr:hypothetical protein [Ottowia caeni]